MQLKTAKEIVEKRIAEMEDINDLLIDAPCDDEDLQEWYDYIETLKTILKEVTL